MINTSLLLTDGIILTIIFSTFVVSTILWKPRLWLHDFPEDIQALMPPKSDVEKRQTVYLAIPFFLILFGGLGWTAIRYGTTYGFWGMALHIYLIWQIINIFDLIVIDWGGMMLIDPMNPPIAGTEGAKGYRDFKFHFIGFLKGSVMGIVLALVSTLVIYAVM